MKTLRIVGVFAMTAMLVAACSVKKSIVGKWEEVGGKERIEFIESGTVSISSGGMSGSGKYSFVGDSHIKIELGGIMALAGAQVATVAISNGELTLTDAKGKAVKYRRVP